MFLKVLSKHLKADFFDNRDPLVIQKFMLCVHYSTKFILLEIGQSTTPHVEQLSFNYHGTLFKKNIMFLLLSMQEEIILYAHLLYAYNKNNFLLQSFLATVWPLHRLLSAEPNIISSHPVSSSKTLLV